MRRLIGLIVLAALIFGAWWLVQNGYDMVRIASDITTAEDASTPAESEQAAETPAESAEAPVAAEGAGTGAGETAAAPDVTAPAGETAGSSATAPDAAGSDATTSSAESAAETPSGKTAAPAAGDVPTFDIVRVEPSGETVIAGLAAPNTKVEVLDGPEAVATAEANERGEWALVLEKPLPPGSHDLAIRTTSPDKSTVTLSDQRVAVAVPEDKKEQPLVVLSTPDAPSAVMQAPGSADVALAPEASPEPGATPSTPETAATPDGSAAPAEIETAVAPSTAPSAPSRAEAPAGTGSSETPSAGSTPESEIATAEPPVVGGESSGGAPAAAPPGSGPAAPETAAEAPATPPAAETAPAKPAPQVGVAAVEAETDGALFVAGTATTKDPVRVYLDDELIGEAEPNDGGTWLLETKREVAPGDYTIRADQVEAGSGAVIVRAEVPFEREIEVAALKQSSESGDDGSAEVSGSVAGPMTVIIKRGDNLWRISRELYGKGIRYSTIYQANRDQIRNPDRIYPGQVMVLPAGDTSWQN